MNYSRAVLWAGLFLIWILPSAHAQEKFDSSAWNQVLKEYVHDGLVDYEALRAHPEILKRFLAEAEQFPVEALGEFSREERITFWINLYNASVLDLILEEHPKERIDEIPAAFEIRKIRAIGEFFSLSEVRDQVLRQGFRDERVLMALVSGRMDSPKLRNEAFHAEKLEDELNQAAHDFTEDIHRNQIVPGTKKIFLSPLFKEFGSDFLLNFGTPDESGKSVETENAVISFFLHHLKNPEKRLFLDSGKYQIHYFPTDSRLNDVRNQLAKHNDAK